MNNKKTNFRTATVLIVLSLTSCTTVKYYPVNFVESLKHPTKFPEVFTFNVQNLEEIAARNPIGENEELKISDIGENKNSSIHLIQVRANGEIAPHYHKYHDEVIYVRRGSGIVILDGTRYMVTPGSMIQIPSKTIHKFQNTSSEVFMAVSIFSPPYDGKDKKMIKERSRADRGNKEQRRLAKKAPRKTAEETVVASPAQVSPTKDIQTAMARAEPGQVIDNNGLDEHTGEFYAQAGKPPRPDNHLIPEKRQEKRTEATLSGSMDIEELHKNLQKLLALREEGTISPEEYEEKKDALVMGTYIGELPEPKKTLAKAQIWEESPPLPEQEQRALPATEDIPPEERKTAITFPDSFLAKEDVTRQGEKLEEETPIPEKMAILEEMFNEGLITANDYERKKEEITRREKEEIISIPAKPPADEKINELKELYAEGLITEDDYRYKLEEITGKTTELPSPATTATTGNEKINELKSLYDEGFITKEDYHYKLKEIASTSAPFTTPREGIENSEKIEELKELYLKGLMTEEVYQFKLNELMKSQGQPPDLPSFSETAIDNEKLHELRYLLEQGLISEEDYAFKSKQLMED